MGSSNRHWPSMFKSKPFNNQHLHQWQHHEHNNTINPNSALSTACHRTIPYSSVPGSEERSPEPKPRWNPKPEQIRILEAIFNSGMVNPPRDEIRRIRAQLQEYGQVGDANVFYWFQNRKSRSKHKLRHPKHTSTAAAIAPPPSTTSSSSSSDKSSSRVLEMTNSPTASVNNTQTYFQAPAAESLPEPFLFPGGFSFPDVSAGVHAPADILLGELMMNHNFPASTTKKIDSNYNKVYNTSTSVSAATVAPTSIVPSATASVTVPSTIGHFLGVGIGESQPLVPAKSTVFINDVAFEVSVGPFNVREAFGDDAVLIQSNGQPVFTNEWGVTLQSLQHGGFYYLVRTLAPVTVSEAQLIWYGALISLFEV